MSEIKRLFTKGNSKLSKAVLTWSIPAGMQVCARECKGCYALKEQRRWTTVLKARDKRWELSKTDKFVPLAVAELQKYGKNFVRVHASGEFYSQEYVDKWVDIAQQCPDLIFYAYTKRMKDFDFTKMLALPNFVLHNSMVDLNGHVVPNYGDDTFILEAMSGLEKQLPFVCPLATDRTGMCGESCTWCMVKENQGKPILFPQH